MVEGTRLITMDERLGLHDTKFEEINEGLSKTRDEFTHKFDGIEGSIAELKQMLLGLQNSRKDDRLVVIQIDEAGSEGVMDNSTSKMDVNKLPSSGNFTNSSSPTPMLHIPPHTHPAQTMHNFTAYTVPLQTTYSTNQQHYSNPPHYSTTTATPNTFAYTNTIASPTNQSQNNHLFIPLQNQIPYYNHTATYAHPNYNSQSSPNTQTKYEPQTFHPIPKIEFPKFTGVDPKSWVLRAEQYFEFIPMDDHRKVKLAGLQFEGRASVWFRYYQVGRVMNTWKVFQADVIARFENLETMDVQDQFNKLKQICTVADYEDKFEELRALVLSKTKGFNEEYFTASFISGLKDHIKGSVKMFRPQTLGDAVFLPKQEESKTTKSAMNNSTKSIHPNPFTATITDTKPTSPIKTYSTGDSKKTRSTLSSNELLERRAK